MNDYPVVFRCSECTVEAPSLDLLESHIWSRHLRSFPYSCSLCSLPAINHSALVSHYETFHFSEGVVEFKRKMTDEMKVREIIASSIVVPVYEEDVEEDRILQHGEVPQGLVEEGVVLEEGGMSMEDMEIISEHEQNQMMQGVTNGGNIIRMMVQNGGYQKEQFQQQSVHVLDDQHGQQMQLHLEEHGMNDNDTMMPALDGNVDDLIEEGEEGSSYAIYSGHELLDEGYEYMDEEGNTIFVTDQFPTTSKTHNNMRMRVLKNRHIDLVVDRVANNGRRTKRAGTVWECPDCGKVVRYPSRIEEHRRSHTGEKPHSCELCGQKFAQKGALKCHMRKHSGERPYVCTWDCGKRFVSASAQRMHEKLHSGERPFACGVCGRLFGKRSHLLRHEASVHRAETIDPRPARGLAAAGEDAPKLREIVEGVLQEVQRDRYDKAVKSGQV